MNSSIYQTVLLKTLGFFVLWLLLSESFDCFHMALGLGASLAVAWFNTDRASSGMAARVWRIFWYFPWLVVRILQSGIHLSKLILHPSLPIDPKMVRHRTKLRDDGGGIVLLGNSITLTPGTITVEVNSQDLIVHAMDDASAEDVTSNRLDQKITDLMGEEGTP